jgi:TatD DNase family protein
LPAVLERAREAGIVRIVVPGWDAASSESALELAARHPDLLVPAVGIHPNWAAAASEDDVRRVERLAAEPAAVAVGEIGLDNHHGYSGIEVQARMFERMLALATTVAKPVLVHDREAHEAITEKLVRWGGPPERAVRGILHCFSGDAEMAATLVGAGFLISFALPVSFSSAVGPRAAAAAIPEDALLVETDAPYLGVARGQRNEPTTTLRVAAELARLRGVSAELVATAAARNLERALGN